MIDGRRTAGQLVLGACERHRRDLERPDLVFDEEAARRPIRFIERALVHTKGEWAGAPLLLAPWQAFIVASLFGWKRKADGLRRFRTGYVEIARKNGKSTLAAALGNYMTVGDGEPGAEVYSAATTRDQAEIVWGEATRQVKRSPVLRDRVQPFKTGLVHEASSSVFKRLSSDYNTLDGLNIHFVAIDELHAHGSRDLWDVLETSTGARRQPMIFGITTAGQEPESVCGQLHGYSDQVVRGSIEDDALFAFIANLDPGDDWADAAVWEKANPNLGISVKTEALAADARRARELRAYQNAFRRLRMNQWITLRERFIDLERWDTCAGGLDAKALEEALEGAPCYAGLDLAKTTDLTALLLVVPPEEDGAPYRTVCRFFMPEEKAFDVEKIRTDGAPYDRWARDGWIIATPGNVTDYAFIRAELASLSERFRLLEVGYDPWNAEHLRQEIEQHEGIRCVPVRQGYVTMSAPTRELDRLLAGNLLEHGGHPVLRWMADNLIVREDPAGNVKPDRAKSPGKIDGIVALLMALDRCLRREGGPSSSVYGQRGLLSL